MARLTFVDWKMDPATCSDLPVETFNDPNASRLAEAAFQAGRGSLEAEIATLTEKLAELEGIDQACDAAQKHVVLLQADLEAACADRDARVRLERMAAIKKAGEAIKANVSHGDQYGVWMAPCEHVIAHVGQLNALISPADASLLNQHDAETRLDERKMAAFHEYRENCTCFHCRRLAELRAASPSGDSGGAGGRSAERPATSERNPSK